MERNRWEDACARICLLTRAAWAQGLPRPMSRPAVRRLAGMGALYSLVLRDVPGVDARTMAHARALLARTKDVAALLADYAERGYRLLLPEDDCWPRVLNCLGTQEPLFLFARGEEELLRHGCVAVAGSRDVEPATADMARRAGRMVAEAGWAMVCGGARGVDRAAQDALLAAGGSLILVPAVPAAQAACGERERAALESGRLLVLCDTLPDEPFSAGKALARNHTIYALADAAIVVASRRGVGGSWRGSTDCLRGGWTPVFAAQGEGQDFSGNRALRGLGAEEIDLSGVQTLKAQIAPRAEQMSLM